MRKLLDIALDERGYLEKATNAHLEEKRANNGYGNYTKYARDLDAIGFFSGKKQGYAWCSVFVSWCFWKAFGAVLAKKMLYQPEKSLAAGVVYAAQYFKDAGQYFHEPQAGDQIFFGANGKYKHTGIVLSVGERYIYTVEGNTNGMDGVVVDNGGAVCKKAYLRDNPAIYGFGRPNWSLIGEGDEDLQLITLRKGDKGAEVKSVQALLIKKFGISCGIYGADGDYGNSTVKAVKTFQQKKGLAVDGIVGIGTWQTLLH